MREFDLDLIHEMNHRRPTQLRRDQIAKQINRALVNAQIERERLLADTEEAVGFRLDFKRQLAMFVHNEFESLGMETRYCGHLAEKARTDTIDAISVMTALSIYTPHPLLQQHYVFLANNMEPSGTLPPRFKVEQALHTNILHSSERELLLAIAESVDKISQRGISFEDWLFSWLADPAYYDWQPGVPRGMNFSPRDAKINCADSNSFSARSRRRFLGESINPILAAVRKATGSSPLRSVPE